MLPWPSASQSQSGLGGFAGPLGRPSSAEETGRHRRELCPEPGSLELPPAASLATAPGGAAPGAAGTRLSRSWAPRPAAPQAGLPSAPHAGLTIALGSALRPPPSPPGAAGALSRPPAARCGRVPPPAALTRGLASVDPVWVRQAGDGEDVGSQEEAS